MKAVHCFGITDEVYTRKRAKKHIGHVFFYEIDNRKKLHHVETDVIKELCKKYNCEIFILKTKAGFHFISFKIFKCSEHMRLFADFMDLLPSDYRHDLKNKILRLSKKGSNHEPKFYLKLGYLSSGHISMAHVKAYQYLIGNPNKYIVRPQKTYAKLCIYKSYKVRK